MHEAYISLVLDDVAICELALDAELLDELGDTVGDMELVGVGIRVLGISQSLDGLESVLVKGLLVNYCL
jgi:hypothetical protein